MHPGWCRPGTSLLHCPSSRNRLDTFHTTPSLPVPTGRQAWQADRQAGSTVYCRPGTWVMEGNCNASRNVSKTPDLRRSCLASCVYPSIVVVLFSSISTISPRFFPFSFPFPFSFLPGQIHYFLGIRHDAHWCEVMPPQHPRQRSCLRFREDVPPPPPPKTTGQATRRQKRFSESLFVGKTVRDGQARWTTIRSREECE